MVAERSAKRLRPGAGGPTLGGMADKAGRYWDIEECGWVKWPGTESTVDVPSQPTGVEDELEADVRSG